LVVGEAGIGKTALLNELTQRARDADLVVLTGHAVVGGGTYRALAEAVLGYLRDGGSLDHPELRPFRTALGRLAPGWDGDEADNARAMAADPVLVLGEGLARLLRLAGDGAGCLLVLDDLHHADADTLAVVQYLVGAARWSGVSLALAVSEEPAPDLASSVRVGASVARLLERQDGVVTRRLGRLAESAVRRMALAQVGELPVADAVMTALVQQAEGWPVLVEELLRSVVDAPAGPFPVPRTLARLVTDRLGSLDADAQRVLHAAAVLGDEPDWPLVSSAAELEDSTVAAALRAGLAAGLLEQVGARLTWRHALTRGAVLTTLLPTERARLANQFVELLTARGEPADVEQAAELLVDAGDLSAATALLLVLARRDVLRGALHSAEGRIGRAAALGATPRRVAVDQVRLLTLQGRAVEAIDVGKSVLDDLTGDEHAELALELARAAITAGRWEQARRLAQRAGRPDDPRSLVLVAEAWFGEGDVARAAELARAAIETSEQSGPPESLCAALVVAGRCSSRVDTTASAAEFGRAAQHAAEHGLVPWRVEALFGLGLVELMAGGPTIALTEARDLAADAGLLTPMLSIDVISEELAMTVDGPASAEPGCRRTAEQTERLGLSGLTALAELGVAAGRAAVGDTAGMDTALTSATGRPHASVEVSLLASAVRALPALLAHDLSRANTLLDAGMSGLVGHGSAAPVAYWSLWVVLRTVVADRDDETRDYLRTAGVAMPDVNRGGLAYADAVVAGRTGDREEAWRLFGEGDRLLAGRPWWRRLLRLLALESAVLDRWGDPVPALRSDLLAHLDQGEDQLARTCRDLLRNAGAETRRGRGDTLVPPSLSARGVTSREMDVLALVVQGLSNAEVANRLFLSPRTVETHVASLLAKTGTSRRTDLRGLADR
jgi:DNA-binding CsgD family transcriptional regulator